MAVSAAVPAPTARVLVALDLDGTLLSEDSRLAAEHEQAVRDLRAMGAQVAIVTGRPLLTTTWVWRRLGLATPVVCFNGGWVGRPDHPPIDQAVLTERQMRTVVDALAGCDGTICGYPDARTWLMERETVHVARWREIYQAPITVDAAAFAPWRGPSCKAMFVCDPGLIPAILQRLDERIGHLLHVVRSQADRIEILPQGITKAWGLERLAAHLAVHRAAVWAVGDADNDREMIAWAGHGCAMGHAPESVRSLARHLLPPVHEHGLIALPALVRAAMDG